MIRNIIPIQVVTPVIKVQKTKANQYEYDSQKESKEVSSNVSINSKSKTKEIEYTNTLLPFIEQADEFRSDKLIDVKEKIKSSFYDNTDNWIDSLMRDFS